MAWWTEHVVPRLADAALSSGGVHKQRALVCSGLTGKVLEIGFGSGLNSTHYPEAVSRIDAIEPSDVGWRLSATARGDAPVTVARVGLDGQQLDAPDGAYETALSTFTLCTIPDVSMALSEVRRVLQPGGTFHFLEHGLAPSPGLAKWQERLNPIQRRVAGGCHLNRQIADLVETAGLTIESLENGFLPGPAVARSFGYFYRGVARA